MQIFSKRAFPLDLLLLILIVAVLFLAAHGVVVSRKAFGNSVTTTEEPKKPKDGGLLCAPCKGLHIDLRTGQLRALPGPGPGLLINRPRRG